MDLEEVDPAAAEARASEAQLDPVDRLHPGEREDQARTEVPLALAAYHRAADPEIATRR